MFLAKVEETFEIRTRGCVIVPATPASDFRLRALDPVQLRTPDGHALDTHIASVELLSGPQVKGRMALLLPEGVTKQDVPIGTEIWLISTP